jgi:hypothetical protein
VRRLIGHANGERGSVGIGIDGYARDIQFAKTANKADGDLTAIGNQDLTEHKGPIVAGSGSFSIQFDDRRAPASGFQGGVTEGFDEVRLLQNPPNRLALNADSTAVDDAEDVESQAMSLGQILLNDGYYVPG